MYFLFLSLFTIFIINQSFATDAEDYFEIDLKNNSEKLSKFEIFQTEKYCL